MTDEEISALPSALEMPRKEWIARFRAARQAAIKASELILTAARAVAKVMAADADTGEVFVSLQGQCASEWTSPGGSDHPGQYGEAGRSRLGMDSGRKGDKTMNMFPEISDPGRSAAASFTSRWGSTR